ncbi:hypothetical protein FCL47_05885 [Desulfopila sp. IMCC35006]|uniref:hypothetical protein n=1 Tax=Desulfopila sp. IMCC35006 TaxID=2569542 RepID=UPI0010AB9CB2|nr:hypothetical protein [Desulfopila sp. IMCC35006]TKB27659.1 hypothetical protein FCL47_05885 [Desulfopila sp. IMCC35006]
MKPGYFLFSSLFKLSAALLILSVLLNLNYPANYVWSWQLLQPSPDVWLLLSLLAVAACFGKRPLFVTSLTVWGVFLALRLFRIGDTGVPMYLNRPLNLYIDSAYLLGLYDLLKTSSRHGDFLLMSTKVTVVVLGAIVASWYAWQTAARTLLDKRVRLFFLILSGSLLCTGLIWEWPTVKPPVTARLGQQTLLIRQQISHQQAIVNRLQKTARDRGTGPFPLNGLQGADVLLFMVESYGHVVFSQPRYRQAMAATMTDFTKILDRHGFTAVSSYLVSPTYGGSSSLAHSSLEFGVKVGNHLEEKALLHSALPPLASYFAESGYRTVSVMPGTRFAFPEGSAFGYDQYYYAWHFNYRGPTFGWAPMSDQFVLDWVRRREFVKRQQPLFVRYVLISSHAAFSIQPPFITDWEGIGDGSVYKDRQLIYYPIYWPDLKNAGEAYLRSLDYEFTILGDYLAKYVSTDSLIIIMGDHQPNLQLTGAGEPWSVPVHIMSRNAHLLEPFSNRGYTPGLIPAQSPPHAGMETFLPQFIEDFR